MRKRQHNSRTEQAATHAQPYFAFPVSHEQTPPLPLKPAGSVAHQLLDRLAGMTFRLAVAPDGALSIEQIEGVLVPLLAADLFSLDNWRQALVQDDSEQIQRDLQRLFRGEAIDSEYCVFTAVGTACWLRVVAVPEHTTGDQTWYVSGVAQDITAAKRLQAVPAEQTLDTQQYVSALAQANVALQQELAARNASDQKLRQQQRWFQAILQHSPSIIFIKDLNGRYLLANERMAASHGMRVEEIQGRTDFDLFPPEIAAVLRRDDLEVLRQGVPMQLEEIIPDAQGVERFKQAVKFPLRDEHQRVVAIVGIITDLTEQRQAEARIAQMTVFDELTGLPNRTFLVGYLSALEHNPQREARVVLFLDLDNFKLLNDSLGLQAGDQLLIEMARRLQQIAPEDALVVRFSGDEFLIFLPDAELSEVMLLAQQVQQHLAVPLRIGAHMVSAQISIGIATLDSATVVASDLLRNANLAMHQAKQRGTGQIVLFDEYLHRQALERWQVATELPHAIRDDELRLHFQPIVDLHSGELVGFEALVRWLHPQRGLLSPRRFIPVAEESGLIVEMDNWVLLHTCQQVADWFREGLLHPRFRVQVNISGRSLLRSDLIDTIASVLETTALPALMLELEITETVAFDYTEEVVRQLAGLRKLGVAVALDDFGTGYASLSSLQNLPIDTLKIDASFVRAINHTTESIAIVEAINALADMLGMKVIAEGIETGDTALLLRGIGCTYGQGFLFSRAAPAAEALAMLQQGTLQIRLP